MRINQCFQQKMIAPTHKIINFATLLTECL